MNRDIWYIACASAELNQRPIERWVDKFSTVLFRDSNGKAHALVNRCPHRNAPLSLGKVVGDRIRCAYHGWEFLGDGECAKIPGLDLESLPASRNAEAYRLVEREGYVWISPQSHQPGNALEFYFPFYGDRAYKKICYQSVLQAPLFYVLENMLDVPHTAFLHEGLFRTGEVKALSFEVRKGTHQVEAEYFGESRPSGILGKLLAPKDNKVQHIDRFILPSIAQVEYRLGNAHLIATSVLTPETETSTRMYAMAAFKLFVPSILTRTFGLYLSKKILKQDAWIVQAQAENIQRFGGEKFTFTKLDVLGPHIRRLLKLDS